MSEQLFYEIIVTDKFGKVVAREHREARSYLKAYNQMVLAGMSQSSQSIKGIDNTNRDSTPSYALLWAAAGAGLDYRGAVVGSGNTAVDISDYKLETQIAEGTGPDQLSHQATDISIPTVGAAESAFTVKRIFVNHSGGDVTVREIGIYVYYSGPTVGPPACIVRDVLVGAVVVPDGGSFTVIYTIKAVE